MNKKKLIYSSIKAIKISEPRIEHLQKTIENLLGIVEFEYKGKPVKIDAFRLKKLKTWANNHCHYSSFINFDLARECNINCVFCVHHGDPKDLIFENGKCHISEEEFYTRLKYYNPTLQTGLFIPLYRWREALLSEKSIKYFKKIREKTNGLLTFWSNGSVLTEKVIKKLSKLKPIFLMLSLNNAREEYRFKFMNDKNPKIAIDSLKLLDKHQIAYAVSILKWPGVDIESLEETVFYVSKHNPIFIRFILPGFTKYSNLPKKHQFENIEDEWKCIIKLANKLRNKISCPLLTVPMVYEDDFYHKKIDKLIVGGVVKNAPAYNLIKNKDIILGINNITVGGRQEGVDYLTSLYEYKKLKKIKLKVLRQKQIIYVTLTKHPYSFPYTREYEEIYSFPFGMIFANGFDDMTIQGIAKIIEENKAKNVVIFVSDLIKPSFLKTIKRLKLKQYLRDNFKAKFRVETAENDFFGKAILPGSLLVCDDYIKRIKTLLKENIKIDLIIIPSSIFFSSMGWKRDLKGDIFKKIEKECKIKVEIIDCEIMNN
ncbi:MAG: radical SAM protein [Pseudomonadota bacterium]